MALHPQVISLLDKMSSANLKPAFTLTPVEARKQMDEMAAVRDSRKTLVGSVEEIDVPGPAGKIVIRIYRPSNQTDKNLPLFIYFHGGGHVIGSLDSHDEVARVLCSGANCLLASVDYRLAPEHKFPAAVDDAKRAYNWMLDNGPEGEERYKKAFISGDSAGGGLSVATTLAIKDDNGILPNAIMPISPWVEMDPVSQSYEDNKELDPFVSKDGIAWFSSVYVPNENERKNPYASPLYGDFKDFPPMLIQVGTREVLLDDSKKLNEKAKSDGCDVEIQIWDDMVHIFQGFAPYLPEANEALESISKFISDK